MIKVAQINSWRLLKSQDVLCRHSELVINLDPYKIYFLLLELKRSNMDRVLIYGTRSRSFLVVSSSNSLPMQALFTMMLVAKLHPLDVLVWLVSLLIFRS